MLKLIRRPVIHLATIVALAVAQLAIAGTAPVHTSPSAISLNGPDSQADIAALVNAAQNSDLAALKALLAKHLSVNVAEGDGMTPLHWAAYNDDLAIGQLLLRAGAFPEPRTRVEGITPLILASGNGSASFIDLLLKANAEVNVANDRGTTPLMQAAASGNTDAISLLLAHGASVNAHEKAYGQTALFFAASHDRADAVRLLLSHGADSSVKTTVAKLTRITLGPDGEPIMPGAANTNGSGRNGQRGRGGAGAGGVGADSADSAATLHRNAAAGSGAGGAQAGAQAVAENGATSQRRFRRSGGDSATNGGQTGGFKKDPTTDAYGQTAADRLARVYGSQTLGGLSALHVAARDGKQQAVIALLDAHADINQTTDTDHATPLILALINGHYDLAKVLLDRGADPKLVTTDGLGPLYALLDVQWSPHTWYPQPVTSQETTPYLDLATELIAHGADLNVRLNRKLWFRVFANDETWIDVAGATPFFRAALAGDLAAMKLLVAKGADPNIATTGDDTPLMAVAGLGWAAYWTANAPYSRLDAAKFCIDHGANIKAVDSKGYTALHGAAFRGDDEMVKFFVAQGADPKARSKEGESTADVANGLFEHALPHASTVALLESLGSTNAHNCRSNECVVAPKDDAPVAIDPNHPAAAPSNGKAVADNATAPVPVSGDKAR